MAKKPIVQRDPDNNILNPDADYIRLITGIVKERAKEKTQKTNLFTGNVKYRVVGDRTFGLNQNEDKNIAGFDVMHPSADPFRDPDVDKERVNSKGAVSGVGPRVPCDGVTSADLAGCSSVKSCLGPFDSSITGSRRFCRSLNENST